MNIFDPAFINKVSGPWESAHQRRNVPEVNLPRYSIFYQMPSIYGSGRTSYIPNTKAQWRRISPPKRHSSLPNTPSLPTTPRPPATAGKIAEFARHLTPCTTDPIRNIDIPHIHFHPSLRDHMDDVDNPERTAAQSTEDGHCSNGPQDELQVEVAADVGATVGFANGHSKDRVRNHPCHDHVGSDGTVVIFLLLGF